MSIVANELFANYDQAVWDWAGTLRVDYGPAFGGSAVPTPKDLSDWPILRVISSPERLASDIRFSMKSQGFFESDYWNSVDGVPDDKVLRVAPLPLCRIERVDVLPMQEFHNVAGRVRHWSSNGLTWDSFKAPTPYEIMYIMEFITLKQRSGVFTSQWMLDNFTPPGAGINTRYLNVQHVAPWGVHMAPLTIDSFSDNSDLESGKDDERLIRWTANLRIRAWNFDKRGSATYKAVPAVRGCRVSMYSGERDLNIDDFGEFIAQTPVLPTVILDEKPLPSIRTHRHTTATRYVEREGYAQQYVIDDNAKFIEVDSVPFRPEDLVQGDVTVLFLRPDGEDAGPLTVKVVWRDQAASDAVTVVQTLTLASSGDAVQYATIPGNTSKEVGLQIFKDSSDPSVRVAITKNRMARTPYTNLVSAGDRTKGPGLGTQTVVTITSLTPGAAYIVRGWVAYGSQAVTVRLYADAGATTLLGTAVLTASGEFVFYGTPVIPGVFLVRITTATADSALVVSGITCAVCVRQPIADVR